MLKEIDEHVARGESDDAILKAFVAEYGPTVLVEPPKAGFNWTAWIMPIAVPLIALFAVGEVLRRWRRSPDMPGTAPSVSPDLLARVERDVERDDRERR
jgi:cytochrome c-type biogenesis protein CcmH